MENELSKILDKDVLNELEAEQQGNQPGVWEKTKNTSTKNLTLEEFIVQNPKKPYIPPRKKK